MTTVLVAFLVAMAASWGLTWGMRYLAPLMGAIDAPDGFRKVHDVPIPRLGGVSVYTAAILPIVLLLWVYPHGTVADSLHEFFPQICGLFLAGLIALGMGAADDLWGMRARYKFLLQVAAGVAAMTAGFCVHRLTIPIVGPVSLGYLAYPVTLFWFVGCMNAINFMDGLDGLAAGVSLFVTMTLLLVGLYFENWYTVLLAACISGAILGFLPHNFHPARIFLGDAGSNALGFLVAALAIVSSGKREATVALLVPMIALGVPIFDTALAIVRRWARRLPISAPDRRHIHHALMRLGLGHRQTVLVLYLASVTLCGLAVLSMLANREALIMVFIALGSIILVSVRVLGMLRMQDVLRRFTLDWNARERTNRAKIELQHSLHRINSVDTVEELWEQLPNLFELLEFDFAALRIQPWILKEQEHLPSTLSWWRDDTLGDVLDCQGFWHTRVRILHNGRVLANLEVGQRLTEGRRVLPETVDLVERLRTGIRDALHEILVHQVKMVDTAEFNRLAADDTDPDGTTVDGADDARSTCPLTEGGTNCPLNACKERAGKGN